MFEGIWCYEFFFSVGGEFFMDNMIIETRSSKIRNMKKLRLVILESTRRRW